MDSIDEDRIGVCGVCGGGGYAVKTTMTDRRFKAVGTIVVGNLSTLMREGTFTVNADIKVLDAVAKQHTKEERRDEDLITTYIYIPNPERGTLESRSQ